MCSVREQVLNFQETTLEIYASFAYSPLCGGINVPRTMYLTYKLSRNWIEQRDTLNSFWLGLGIGFRGRILSLAKKGAELIATVALRLLSARHHATTRFHSRCRRETRRRYSFGTPLGIDARTVVRSVSTSRVHFAEA